jgi:transcriptional regulator with XRE-family HTH domain
MGDAIRAARKEDGFTREKLAEKTDFSTVFISRVERGKESPPLDTATRQQITPTHQITLFCWYD